MNERQVALLRGINVGKTKRVAMADLRALLEKLGFTSVKTLLNSGNVVYTSDGVSPDDARERIERALMTELGVSSRTTVLTQREIDGVVAANLLEEVALNPSRYQLAFLADRSVTARLTPLLGQEWGPEAVALGERVAYLWCPDGILVSPLFDAAARLFGTDATVRTWGTVLKIHSALRNHDGGSQGS